jgi:hypothetical protein
VGLTDIDVFIGTLTPHEGNDKADDVEFVHAFAAKKLVIDLHRMAMANKRSELWLYVYHSLFESLHWS